MTESQPTDMHTSHNNASTTAAPPSLVFPKANPDEPGGLGQVLDRDGAVHLSASRGCQPGLVRAVTARVRAKRNKSRGEVVSPGKKDAPEGASQSSSK